MRVHSFVFDANRCTGCQACQLACVIENDLDPDSSWRQVYTFNERRLPGLPLFHLSLACNHCAAPACLAACPARAYSKDKKTGAVLLDPEKCIGCRYCDWACPYDAPRFDPNRGVMTKCTFCNDRIHEGNAPACAELCPTGALRFEALAAGDLTNEIEGFPRSGLQPAIRILPLQQGKREPDSFLATPAMPFHIEPQPRAARKVSLRTEWSLAAFTLLGAVLFGRLAAAVAGGPGMRPEIFLGLAALGLALGTAHLGRKTRAWRAVLGFANSWLSREIVFFAVFVASGSLYLAGVSPGGATGAFAVLAGLAALYSMDSVYGYATRPAFPFLHSAGLLLTGLFLAGVLKPSAPLMLIAGVAKLSLYVARKTGFAGSGRPVRPEVSVSRIALGFLLPAAIWLVTPLAAQELVILMVIVGDVIDRGEFYAELEFASPSRQMAIDLARRTTGRGRPRPLKTS